MPFWILVKLFGYKTASKFWLRALPWKLFSLFFLIPIFYIIGRLFIPSLLVWFILISARICYLKVAAIILNKEVYWLPTNELFVVSLVPETLLSRTKLIFKLYLVCLPQAMQITLYRHLLEVGLYNFVLNFARSCFKKNYIVKLLKNFFLLYFTGVPLLIAKSAFEWVGDFNRALSFEGNMSSNWLEVRCEGFFNITTRRAMLAMGAFSVGRYLETTYIFKPWV